MKSIGLMTPITVRYCPDRPSDDGLIDDSHVLVAGAHRLAAAKSLGWKKIECFLVDEDDLRLQLWEISENLHRAELTALERDEQIARWIDLTAAVSSQVATKPGRPEGGVRAAARELGVDKDDAHRAVKIASLSEEAKQAAREADLDDNRSALLAAAKEPTPEKQVAKLSEIATEKRVSKRPRKDAEEDGDEFEPISVPEDAVDVGPAKRREEL